METILLSPHVSTMSGKLNGIPAINTNTVTNDFCQKMQQGDNICKDCYSQSMLTKSRKNCQPSFQRNSDLLSATVLPLKDLPVTNSAWFRFNGHGELINMTHLINLSNIAWKNPQTNFALWTKRKNLIKKYLDKEGFFPKNLILIYSNPKVNSIIQVPKYFHKVFNVLAKDNPVKGNCTGQKCMDCLRCYRHEGDSIINEHIKKR